MSEPIRLEQREAVAVVTFDNPPVNALSEDVLRTLDRHVESLRDAQDIRAIVLTGAGDQAFVAGADIKEFPELLERPGAMEERTAWSRGIFDRLAALPQPVIAAVQANAVGGGTEIALLCDMVLADPAARFGLTEVRLGLIPGGGGTQRLARLVGPRTAKELVFTGRTISAEEAAAVGLINRVSAPGAVLEEALATAERLASLPRVAVQPAKRAIDEGVDLSLPAALDRERALFLETFSSDDLREGYAAFLEKRPPQFSHR